MHCIKRLSKQSTRNTVQMGKTGVTSRWKKIEEGNEIQIGEEKSLTWKSINATCLFFWESVMWRLSPLLIKHINMLYYYVININSGDVWHLLVSTQKVVCNSPLRSGNFRAELWSSASEVALSHGGPRDNLQWGTCSAGYVRRKQALTGGAALSCSVATLQ